VSREEATFNGVPGWLLADYLADLGGDAKDGAVHGDGWSATLVIPPRPEGAMGLGRVVVGIEGEMAAEVMAALRAKAMRGGG
jgi:hypothetical protein